MGNREIKFRGFSETTGMFQIDVLAISECTWQCPDANRRGVSLVYQTHIKVMQFTGLTDKRGNEIYEDDVLLFSVDNSYFDYNSNRSIPDIRNIIAPVEFINGSFCVDGFRLCDIFHEDYLEDSPEILGDIHRNKELLNNGK